MDIKVSEEVQTALVKFNAGPITPHQFAQHLGFTDRQIHFLNIFQPSVFNQGWVFLDPTVIAEWFCGNDESEAAVRNFNNRILPQFKEGIDYKEVPNGSPEWTELYRSRMIGKTEKRGGSKIRFFWVTPDCFKDIGMIRNKEIRAHFIAVEKMFYYLMEYGMQSQIININKRMNAQLTMTNEARAEGEEKLHKERELHEAEQKAKDDEIARVKKEKEDAAREAKMREDELQLKRETEQKEHENAITAKEAELKDAQDIAKKNAASANKWVEAAVDTALVPKTHVMYIASNVHLMKMKRFKIGGDENIKNCMKRIQGYCTMYPADDPVYAIAIYQCHDYKTVENLFWLTGERHRDKQSSLKEMIWLEKSSVIRILEDALWSIDQNVASHVSQYVEFKRSTVEDEPTIYEPLDLTSVLTHKPKEKKKTVAKIDAADMTDAAMHAIIIEKINMCMRETVADYDFATHKLERDVKISWKLFAPKFDSYDGKTRTQWRAATKLICDGTKMLVNYRDT